jgi:DNA-binding response OmpR family regulator
MKILLVEDTPESIQLLTRILTYDGHEVLHTAYGLEAMQLARQKSFDALLLDFDLPDMDGSQICLALRSVIKCPIIAVTSHADRVTRKKAALFGFDGFIPKPINIEEFLGTIRALAPTPVAQATQV